MTAAPESAWHRYLWLTPRRVGLVALVWVLAVVAHNVVYGLLRGLFEPGWDEPVFFVAATILVPGYFLVSALYTVATLLRRRAQR